MEARKLFTLLSTVKFGFSHAGGFPSCQVGVSVDQYMHTRVHAPLRELNLEPVI